MTIKMLTISSEPTTITFVTNLSIVCGLRPFNHRKEMSD